MKINAVFKGELLKDNILGIAMELVDDWFEHPSESPVRVHFSDLIGVYLNAWATPNCNPYGSGVNLAAELDGLGLPHRDVPSDTMVRDARVFKPVEEQWIKDSEKGREINPEIQRQVKRMEEQTSTKLVAIANRVVKDLGWLQEDLLATIDGHGVPSYGKASMLVNVPEEYVHQLSTSEVYTKPGVRNKKTKIGDTIQKGSVPENKGTWRKHEWFHLTLHNKVTKESLPIAVLFRVGTKAQEMQRAIDVLQHLVQAPKCILMDREFTAAYDCLKVLRDYADRRGVYIIGPMKAHTVHVDAAKKIWRERSLEAVVEHDAPLWYKMDSYHSEKDSAGGHFIGHFFQRLVDKGIKNPEKWQAKTVVTAKGDPVPVQVFMLYCNLNVELEDASWMLKVYARRWACETYFQVYSQHIGRSQSDQFTTRCFGYAGGHVLLAMYGAWRAYRTNQHSLTVLDPEADETALRVEMRAFLGRLRGQIRRQFLAEAKAG